MSVQVILLTWFVIIACLSQWRVGGGGWGEVRCPWWLLPASRRLEEGEAKTADCDIAETLTPSAQLQSVLVYLAFLELCLMVKMEINNTFNDVRQKVWWQRRGGQAGWFPVSWRWGSDFHHKCSRSSGQNWKHLHRHPGGIAREEDQQRGWSYISSTPTLL